MERGKFKAVIVQHWAPVTITGLLGVLAGVVYSSVDSVISDNRFFLEKQAKTAENVTDAFSRYVENIRRINELKAHVEAENKRPTEEQIERLQEYVIERTDARDKLFSSLNAVSLYFSKNVSDKVFAFRNWDTAQSNKTSINLPDVSEWQERQRTILLSMRKELVK